MKAVVETDLDSISRLADINNRLQATNAEVFRLMTLVAARDHVRPSRASRRAKPAHRPHYR